MPQYYFNVCFDDSEETDVVGCACDNDVEALSRALVTASHVVRRRLSSDSASLNGCIQVEDENHRAVLRLPIRAAAY